MPPRKTRAAKAAEEPVVAETEPVAAPSSSKGKAKAEEVQEAAEVDADAEATAQEEAKDEAASNPAMTMAERMEKMRALRKKMADSTTANRRAVAAEANRSRQSAKQQEAMARKMAKAEKVLDERDAREAGEDWERSRAWGYSIEDNEKWEEGLRRKDEKRDKGMTDFNATAARSYNRQIAQLKPDLKSYDETARQLSTPSAASLALVSTSGGAGQVVRREELGSMAEREHHLSYGGHRPSDAAVDRVIGHLNMEADARSKRSRVRHDEEGAEVNYINDQNKHFNKKIKRFYDGYTKETRENLERGTAL